MPPRTRKAVEQEQEPPPEEGMVAHSGYIPIDKEAEIAVMAAILTSPDAYFDVSSKLDPSDFGVPALAEVYRAVAACDQAGKPFDVITVADELKRSKTLTLVGGVEALNRLVDRAASVSNVVAHAEIVVEKALLRRLVTAGRTITAEAMNVETQAKEALAAAESTVFELGKQKGTSSLIEMPQAVATMLEELSRTRTSLLVGHSTGFKELDRMTGGFQGGQLIVLAARPGAGKSAFALQLARNIAESSGLVVPFLSYEMSSNELTMRMLSGALEHDLPKLRSGDIPPGMELDLAREAERMAQLPVMIDDNPPETIGGVRSQMRRLARRGQVGAVVVDYLQLMSGDRVSKDSNRTQEVSDISRGLKRLSTELDVPVIALSQLNRGLENRPNKRPMLSDLRESGSIEQDASLVLFLYRDSLYNAAADPAMAECIVGKQRNGPQGIIHLEFIGACAKFKDTDRRPADAGGSAGPSAPAAGSTFSTTSKNSF